MCLFPCGFHRTIVGQHISLRRLSDVFYRFWSMFPAFLWSLVCVQSDCIAGFQSSKPRMPVKEPHIAGDEDQRYGHGNPPVDCIIRCCRQAIPSSQQTPLSESFEQVNVEWDQMLQKL